ncbi:MAG: hypothetical protein V3S25_09810 [Nitrospirales bacterium]
MSLFYGPEQVEEGRPIFRCIFNVKKRSWKSGIQVSVQVTETQVAQVRQSVAFESWLRGVLAALPEEERAEHEARAHDAFIQALCALKLDLAIEAGLSQEHRSFGIGEFVDALSRAVAERADRLKAQVLTELDLPVGESGQ